MKAVKTIKNDSCKLNHIKISLQECVEVEVESEELNFEQLKLQTLELLEIAKKNVIRTPVNRHEVA